MAGEPSVQKFGEYHLVERIAVGGMAEVWRARAYGLAGFEKTLVIKKILDNLGHDEEFVRLFIDEARIAVRLQHHNIVQVFDLGTADGTLYMAMEYVQGTDLARLIRRMRDREPVPVPLALFVVSEILKALRFAHERRNDSGHPMRIVHCDISPQNVLISHAGEVKITDFGISRAAFQAASLHDTVRGKYAYMSPEQVENKQIDGRSDLFSLGIVLWETLTGRRLFKAKTKEETLARVKRAEVSSPRPYRQEVSEDLERVLLKALARDPQDRYADAAEMLDAIGMLMVREGHRVTNHDLAAYLRLMGPESGESQSPKVRSVQRTLVVLALEAGDPDGRVGADALPAKVEAWSDAIVREGGQIWEREQLGLLAVWVAEEDSLEVCVKRAVDCVLGLRAQAAEEGLSVYAGLSPGRARIFADTRRPGRNWELAGPFYLARWLMNLSIRRGSVLVTRAAGQRLGHVQQAVVGSVDLSDGTSIEVRELLVGVAPLDA